MTEKPIQNRLFTPETWASIDVQERLRENSVLITIDYTPTPIGELLETTFDHILAGATGEFPKWFQHKARVLGVKFHPISDILSFPLLSSKTYIEAKLGRGFPGTSILRYGPVAALALNDLWFHHGEIDRVSMQNNRDTIRFTTFDKTEFLGDIHCLLILSHTDVLATWSEPETPYSDTPWIPTEKDVDLFNKSLRTHYERLKNMYHHTIVIDRDKAQKDSTHKQRPLGEDLKELAGLTIEKLVLVHQQVYEDLLGDESKQFDPGPLFTQ